MADSTYIATAVEDSRENRLGAYLRDRRARLDAAALGFPTTRRRTPGLRREEVAQRACVSATWYTWLEQGRGGAPSADVLDRLARALMLTAAEREHLYLLALGRPPEVRYHPADAVTPRLQRVLDALPLSPAMLRTATWDIVAWNRAAQVVLTDYAALEPEARNVLHHFFTSAKARERLPDWESDARFIVAAFRADVARSGAEAEVRDRVERLIRLSPEFAAMWAENDVRTIYGDVAKTVIHPTAGRMTLDYSSFAVDGRPDLSLIVYTAATPEDASKIAAMIKGAGEAGVG